MLSKAKSPVSLSITFIEVNEKLLQYIWQFQYYNNSELETTTGESLAIISPGHLNTNQGPDFLEAKIKIGETLLAGSIELHLKTSDWHRHNHDSDKNYKNVILHVVYKNDMPEDKHPVLELQPLISNLLLEKYSRLMSTGTFIPCSNSIIQVNELTWFSWKERLLAERLTRKSKRIFELLSITNYHWEEVFWWLLARNFGMKVNADAFEDIARSIPVNILAKHKHQIHQIEALLFGQGNLLKGDFNDDYPKLLQREYRFLKKKYILTDVHSSVQHLRMRPGNFPNIRLAELAVVIKQSTHLFTKIIEAVRIEDIKELFNAKANDYWHYHYVFDNPGKFKPKVIGVEMVNNILINTVVPMIFAYGIYHNNESLKSRALVYLEQIQSENNSIISGFRDLKLEIVSAYDSQALIELKNEYCSKKRCLACSVGNAILRN